MMSGTPESRNAPEYRRGRLGSPIGQESIDLLTRVNGIDPKATFPRAPRDQCPARGATAALVLASANTEAFSLHLAEISKEVASGAHATDLKTPDNITLLPLPSYSPELNPMENVWEYLRKTKLAITVFNDYDHIVDNQIPRLGTGQALGRLV